MPRVLVILPTQTYRATEFVNASSELGVDLIVAAEEDLPIDMGDRFLKIDCSNPAEAARAIVEFGDSTHIDAIVAADDAGVVIAAMAGTKLGLPANDPDAAAATRDKILLRSALEAGEVPQPPWKPLSSGDVPDLGFPVVVKPLDRSAGQGVIRADDQAELDTAIRRTRSIIESTGAHADADLIVEGYVGGDEVAVEGLVGPNGLLPLAIFDKPSPLQGEGFQETILVTPSRHSPEIQEECLRVAAATVKAVGLTRGPVHIEMKIGAGRVVVIEAAARSIGGLCSRSLSFGLMDTSLETLILRNALNMDKPELRRSKEASGVLMIPIPRSGTLEAIHGLGAVRELDGVSGFEIDVNVGELVAPPPEGSRYLGFVFATAEHPSAVEDTLVAARDLIEVEVR